jgi:hypothetical protein
LGLNCVREWGKREKQSRSTTHAYLAGSGAGHAASACLNGDPWFRDVCAPNGTRLFTSGDTRCPTCVGVVEGHQWGLIQHAKERREGEKSTSQCGLPLRDSP